MQGVNLITNFNRFDLERALYQLINAFAGLPRAATYLP